MAPACPPEKSKAKGSKISKSDSRKSKSIEKAGLVDDNDDDDPEDGRSEDAKAKKKAKGGKATRKGSVDAMDF